MRDAAILAIGLCAPLAAIAPAAAQRPDAPFTGNLVPQGSPIPRILPLAPPSVAPGAGLTAPAAPAATPAATVAVRGVSVVGATAFTDAQVTPLLGGLVGPAIPLEAIERARAALVSLYRGDGFVLTTVNAQVGPTGELRFNVVEGHIAAVKLDGDIGPAGVQVLRFLNHLTEAAAARQRYPGTLVVAGTRHPGRHRSTPCSATLDRVTPAP